MRFALLARCGAALVAAAAAILVLPGTATAHVTVTAAGAATQGGYTKVSFRVPNEKDTANTVKLEVAFPTGTPIGSASIKPVPGWTAVAETGKLASPVKTVDGEVTEAITKITWTAEPNTGIKPHEFQEFDVSMGPLPAADQVVFKALQTYSDGDVVRWIDEPAAGAEAEHPAPVLKLAKAGAATGAPAEGSTAQDAAAVMNSGEDNLDGTMITLSILALILGFAGLLTAVLAYRRAGTQARP